MFNIKVIDKESELYGQILKGYRFYYDINHTGDSDDLYVAETKDNTKVQLLSFQIDEKYYIKQELEEVIKELGANTGDKVIILKGGSCSYSKGWRQEGIHIITDIDCAGHVVFDDGEATIFRPKVKLVED